MDSSDGRGLVRPLRGGAGRTRPGRVPAVRGAWDRAFSGRPVVTLCPFVIGEIDARAALERMHWLAPMHDSMLLPDPGGGYVPDR